MARRPSGSPGRGSELGERDGRFRTEHLTDVGGDERGFRTREFLRRFGVRVNLGDVIESDREVHQPRREDPIGFGCRRCEDDRIPNRRIFYCDRRGAHRRYVVHRLRGGSEPKVKTGSDHRDGRCEGHEWRPARAFARCLIPPLVTLAHASQASVGNRTASTRWCRPP